VREARAFVVVEFDGGALLKNTIHEEEVQFDPFDVKFKLLAKCNILALLKVGEEGVEYNLGIEVVFFPKRCFNE